MACKKHTNKMMKSEDIYTQPIPTSFLHYKFQCKKICRDGWGSEYLSSNFNHPYIVSITFWCMPSLNVSIFHLLMNCVNLYTTIDCTEIELKDICVTQKTSYQGSHQLEIFLQMVHNTTGRYETPSLHTTEWEASQVSKCCGQGLGSDPNGGLT